MTRRPARLVTVAAACVALLPLLAGPPSAEAGHAASPSSTGLRSTFDDGAEGWTSQEAGDPTAWVSVGGNPGGATSVQRGSGGTTGLRSPASWAGSRTELLGGRLSFDVELGPDVESQFFEVGLVPSTGVSGVIYTQVPDLGGQVPDWTSVTLPIKGDGSWFQNGQPAGAAEFDGVLSNLSYVYVAAFTQDNADTMYLDNVVLASPVKRSVTLGLRSSRFYGRLTPGGACAAKQKVTVLRVRPGPDAVVGKARTDASGEYGLRAKSPAKGAYYASVDAGFEEGGGDCSAARSKALKVR